MATTTNLGLTLPTVGADDDTWGTINNTVLSGLDATFAGAASGATLASLFPNYISGLVLSAAGATATFGIAVGAATDSANAAIMRLGSAYTKTASSWAVGTGNGSLDTGSVANSTWYHVWLIQRSDTKVVDVLTSTSATSPTMPSNYDRKRRIGAMKTDGSAQWVKFVQIGDNFLWDAPVGDISATNLSTTPTLYTLASVPTGIIVDAIINADFRHATLSNSGLIYSPSVGAQASRTPEGNVSAVIQTNNSIASASINGPLFTNTSAQVYAVATAASTTIKAATKGWRDPRGQW